MEYRPEPVADSAGRIDAWPPEIVEFVRHAYRRRPVAWPELYDELTRMASRGTFRGLGFAELAEKGLSFSLCELPKLAQLSTRVAAEEEALGRSGEDAAAEQPVDPLEHVAVTAEPTNRPQPRLVRRVPPHMHGIGTRLSVVRGAAS